MRAEEFVTDGKATAKTCRKGREGKKIGISARSSCRSQGLMPRSTGHTDGTGKQGKRGSGKPLDGRYVKGAPYGGPTPDYSKKRKSKKSK